MPTDIIFNIFIAYSRKDSGYLDEIRSHFTPLERSGKVTIWYDGKIEPGAVWETEIKERLHTADIILLLVSASAIASDYFYDKEMKDALERHRLGTTKVVPFILRPCTWKATPLAKLQVIPKDGKAATTWNDRDEAYSDAVNSLWDMISNMEQRRLEGDKAEKETKEEQRLKEEAEEERKLKEKAATKRQQEERRVKEHATPIKNAHPPDQGSEKIPKEMAQIIAKYKVPLIIIGTLVVLAIVLWGAFSGGNSSSNVVDDNKPEATKDSVEMKAWNNARTQNTVPEYDRYREDYPNGIYFSEAMDSINKIVEKNDWDTALSLGTLEAYQKYLDANPTGSHAGEANQKITEIINLAKQIGIGKKYQGGIIFYVDNTGKHGLIAAEKDLGDYNWEEAMNQCKNLRLNGYDDWRLPTQDELDKLYLKKDKVGGFASAFYWSSSESSNSSAWGQFFNYGGQGNGLKSLTYRVRAVRAF